jgi:hypothetical protein
MIGVLTLGAAIFTAFTGYLSASSWSAQWHGVVVLLVAIHVSFIRHEGPVKPYPAKKGGGK